MFWDCENLTDIKFSSSLGSNNTPIELNLSDCGKNKGYKLSDKTWESMLNMYDRRKAGLEDSEIVLSEFHNIPKGWKMKMSDKGYIITIL